MQHCVPNLTVQYHSSGTRRVTVSYYTVHIYSPWKNGAILITTRMRSSDGHMYCAYQVGAPAWAARNI